MKIMYAFNKFIYPSTDFGYIYCFEVNYFKTKTHEPVEIPQDKVDLWLKISSVCA